jgi:hypothetical protein
MSEDYARAKVRELMARLEEVEKLAIELAEDLESYHSPQCQEANDPAECEECAFIESAFAKLGVKRG